MGWYDGSQSFYLNGRWLSWLTISACFSQSMKAGSILLHCLKSHIRNFSNDRYVKVRVVSLRP